MLTCIFVIPSLKQKHTTGSLTLTHRQQQLQTKSSRACHITSFDWLRHSFCVWNSNNLSDKKNADIGLAVGMLTDFDPMKACFKCSQWFGKWHKTDAFTKLTGISDQLIPFLLAFFFFFLTSTSPSSSWAHCIPNKSVPTLRYAGRHLLSAVPKISEACLLQPAMDWNNTVQWGWILCVHSRYWWFVISPLPPPLVYVCVTAHQQTTVKPNNNWIHIIIFIWTLFIPFSTLTMLAQ